jgi:hypothetical protein
LYLKSARGAQRHHSSYVHDSLALDTHDHAAVLLHFAHSCFFLVVGARFAESAAALRFESLARYPLVLVLTEVLSPAGTTSGMSSGT